MSSICHSAGSCRWDEFADIIHFFRGFRGCPRNLVPPPAGSPAAEASTLGVFLGAAIGKENNCGFGELNCFPVSFCLLSWGVHSNESMQALIRRPRGAFGRETLSFQPTVRRPAREGAAALPHLGPLALITPTNSWTITSNILLPGSTLLTGGSQAGHCSGEGFCPQPSLP